MLFRHPSRYRALTIQKGALESAPLAERTFGLLMLTTTPDAKPGKSGA
jgi:hypothetical protein